MEGDPPAGPQGTGPGPDPDPRRPDPQRPDPDPRPPDPAPTAQGAEQGEQGAAEEPPSSDTPQDLPTGREDTPVGAATNAAAKGDPPPSAPPPRKRVRFECPPCPADWSQEEPIFYQPRLGQRARPFHPQGIPPGALPYNIYTGQPRTGSLPAGYRQELPRDHLVEAVLVTVFCCMLTGAMALIYSHETRAAIRRGDIDQAFSASRKAWFLILFSLLFGLFVSITWVICVLATLYMQRGP